MSKVLVDIVVRTDGGSNPNPGPSGVAFTVEEKGKLKCAHCEYIEMATNNEAEYIAIVMALEYLKAHFPKKRVKILSDSQLVISQMKGEYKVKANNLLSIREKIDDLLKGMKVEFEWNERKENKIADRLVRFVRGEIGIE